jgi:hypothetical protein
MSQLARGRGRTVADLVEDLERRGVRMTVRGDRVVIVAPRGVIRAGDLEVLTRHKATVVALLAGARLDPPSRPPGVPTYGYTQHMHVVELATRTPSEERSDPIKLVTAEGWPGWYPVTAGDLRERGLNRACRGRRTALTEDQASLIMGRHETRISQRSDPGSRGWLGDEPIRDLLRDRLRSDVDVQVHARQGRAEPGYPGQTGRAAGVAPGHAEANQG